MGGRRPREESGQTPAADELGGLVVLVVDDEPVVRAFVARALAVAGIEVAVAADGREALRLVAEDRVRPRVVVTDIEMPQMTGIELAARLLAIRPSIRIVMMTGDPERAEAARRHPGIVDDVLLKPMQVETLIESVRAVAVTDPAGRPPRGSGGVGGSPPPAGSEPDGSAGSGRSGASGRGGGFGRARIGDAF